MASAVPPAITARVERRRLPGSASRSDRIKKSCPYRSQLVMSPEIVTIASIASVYRKRGADLFRLALARTSDRELARDVVQGSFARAIRARAGFRGSGSLEAWLCRCVLNATRDSRLSAGERELHEADADRFAPKPVAPNADVRVAVRRLTAHQRDVLFLRFCLDYDYLTIAETLGIEAGTVSATLHVARRTLAQALEEVAR